MKFHFYKLLLVFWFKINRERHNNTTHRTFTISTFQYHSTILSTIMVHMHQDPKSIRQDRGAKMIEYGDNRFVHKNVESCNTDWSNRIHSFMWLIN